MKLVDADLLKDELGEELLSIAKEIGKANSNWLITIQDIYMRILCKIDSIPKYEINNDFLEEVNKLWLEQSYFNFDRCQQVATMSNSDYMEMARHFAKWQKEQIMKDAVDAEVVDCAIIVEREIMRTYLEHEHLKNGDKVRLIAIKEDQ